MPVVSSFFLILALILAVVIGPQTRMWTWGPAMLALGIGVLAAIPALWQRGRKMQADLGILIFAAMVAGWFTWRTFVSPVAELGHYDLLLLCGAVGSFICVRAITGHAAAERLLFWGVAMLLVASAAVAGLQLLTPSFSPVFAAEATHGKVVGFVAHYNEAANYFIASALITGAAALVGRHATATRLSWCLAAAAGIACVWFTRSRGGILGAAFGCGVLTVLVLAIGKRRDAKWFAPALIALPLIGIAIAAFLWMGWKESQLTRTAAAHVASMDNATLVERVFDNDARLHLLGIAASCIGEHPLTGGGSGSYSWESNRFYNPRVHSFDGHRPDMVHNELIQAATDYGLVGAALLTGLLGALALATILRLLFEDRPKEADARDAWRVGALAALAGMLVQSCFSFVFHLMPGVILLGICLGMLSRAESSFPGKRVLGARALLTLAAIGCSALLLPAGWKGTRATLVLWPTWFSKQPETSAEARVDALTEAIAVWPLAEFYQARAAVFQRVFFSQGRSGAITETAELAVDDYAEAARLHPLEPSHPINRANLLSHLGRDAEAEAAYAHGIQLQGGMEPGFRGHFSLAEHHLRKGVRFLEAGQQPAAISSLEAAASEMQTAVSMMHWVIKDMVEPHYAIHETLGALREAAGDHAAALLAYDQATSLNQGRRAHYHAAVILGKMAVDAWSRRDAPEALKLFLKARARIGQARNDLPASVTASQQAEYVAYLDRVIAFLKGAKVQPAE